MGWKDSSDEDNKPISIENDILPVNVSVPFRTQNFSPKKCEDVSSSFTYNRMIELIKKVSLHAEDVNDNVSLSLGIDKKPTTSVDFTLRKCSTSRPKSWYVDKLNDDYCTSKTVLEGKKLTNSDEKQRSVKKKIDENKLTEKIKENKNEDKKKIIIKENKIKKEPLSKVTAKYKQNDDDKESIDDNKMTRLIFELYTDSEYTVKKKKQLQTNPNSLSATPFAQ